MTVHQHANHHNLLILCHLQTSHASSISKHLDWSVLLPAAVHVHACVCASEGVSVQVYFVRQSGKLWGLKGEGCVSSVGQAASLKVWH